MHLYVTILGGGNAAFILFLSYALCVVIKIKIKIKIK
jgi:hypothetical protein